MTQEKERSEIIRMACEAGLEEHLWLNEDTDLPKVKRFAQLVAAAEREACAKVCEDHAYRSGILAEAIRARGQQ